MVIKDRKKRVPPSPFPCEFRQNFLNLWTQCNSDLPVRSFLQLGLASLILRQVTPDCLRFASSPDPSTLFRTLRILGRLDSLLGIVLFQESSSSSISLSSSTRPCGSASDSIHRDSVHFSLRVSFPFGFTRLPRNKKGRQIISGSID